MFSGILRFACGLAAVLASAVVLTSMFILAYPSGLTGSNKLRLMGECRGPLLVLSGPARANDVAEAVSTYHFRCLFSPGTSRSIDFR